MIKLEKVTTDKGAAVPELKDVVDKSNWKKQPESASGWPSTLVWGATKPASASGAGPALPLACAGGAQRRASPLLMSARRSPAER